VVAQDQNVAITEIGEEACSFRVVSARALVVVIADIADKLVSPKAGRRENEDRCPSATCCDREFADSPVEESGFEPMVPL
jgi:hypothetical protein